MASRLSKTERKYIVSMRELGMTEQSIADRCGKSQSTVSRVLKDEGYEQIIEAQRIELLDTKMELADTKLALAKMTLAYVAEKTQQNMLPLRQ